MKNHVDVTKLVTPNLAKAGSLTWSEQCRKVVNNTIISWAQDPEKNHGSSISLNGEMIILSKQALEKIADAGSLPQERMTSWVFDSLYGKTSPIDPFAGKKVDRKKRSEIIAMAVQTKTLHSLNFKTRNRKPHKPKSQPTPPKSCEVFLYALLPRRTRDAVIGDLAEDYNDACKRYGETAARRLYLWDAACSLIPVLEAFVVRISKWAGAAVLGEFLRHFVK